MKNTGIEVKETAKKYTYADYVTWDDEYRYELIDGIVYVDGKPFNGVPGKAVMLTPAPAWAHQRIIRKMLRQFDDFLQGKSCEVFCAPFDVRLDAEKGDDTVIQPDIVVVCDLSKLVGTGYSGVPEMVIEVLSPSTAGKDKVSKFNKYRQAGVREYWIVDPESMTVSVHVLKDGEYTTAAYGNTDTVSVRVLDGCLIDMMKVFAG